MKSKLTTMTIIMALIASTIYAQNIPQKISFQGRLIDANTQKPVTAEKNFTFKIGDWIEEHKNVQVSNGLYSVILGSINPIPLTLFDDWQANMKILVDGKEMAPDIEMVSVPFAFKASYAEKVADITFKDMKVGIGTNNPIAKLHIKNIDDNADQYSGIKFYPATNEETGRWSYHYISGFRHSGLWIGGSSNGSVFVKSNILLKDEGLFVCMSDGSINPENNCKLSVLNNGFIGIETKEPKAMIDIAGRTASDTPGESHKIRFTYGGTGLFGFRVGGPNSTLNIDRFDYSSNWQSIISISRPTARVGINNSNPSYTLDVNGTIACNKLLETSDIRYKKNITPIQTPLQKVTQLKGINYEWKTEEYSEKNFSNGKQIGMIAQDVEKVIPEIVHTDNEGMKSISYDKITAVLVEAMKELNQKNEKAIQELKAENAQLKQIICEDRPNHEFCQN
jgi:hypothetical protein